MGVTAGGAARTLGAVALGLAGAVASIRGWGPVVMAPDVQPVAVGRLVLLGTVFGIVASASSRAPIVLWAARAGVVVALPLATASNAGRSYGVVAAVGLVVAHAALVDRWPPRAAEPAGREAALLACSAVAGAQVALVLDGAALALALIAGGGVLLVVHSQRPAVLAPVDGVVARAARALGAAMAASHRRGSRVAATTGDRSRRAAAASGRTAGTVGRTVRGAGREGWQRVGERWGRLRAVDGFGIVVASSVATGAVMAPVFWRYATTSSAVLGFSDFETHLEAARRVEPPLGVAAPHPVFHVAVHALTAVVGEAWATTLVLAGAVSLTVVVIAWIGTLPLAGRPPIGARLGAALGVGYVVVESPAMVANALRIGNPYSWAPANHMLLSPTDTLYVPFALVLVVVVTLLVTAPVDRLPRAGVVAAVTVVATLVKPSLTLPLLAVVPVAVVLGDRSSERARCAAAFLVPALVVVAWQAWFVSSGAGVITDGGAALRPLDTVRVTGLDRVDLLLFAPMLVIVLCLWAAARRYVREPLVLVSACCLAINVLLLLLVNETGPRRADGTFAKPAFAAWIVVHIVSWRVLAGEAVAARRSGRTPSWLAASVAFVAVGAVAGILVYLDAVGISELPRRAPLR